MSVTVFDPTGVCSIVKSDPPVDQSAEVAAQAAQIANQAVRIQTITTQAAALESQIAQMTSDAGSRLAVVKPSGGNDIQPIRDALRAASVAGKVLAFAGNFQLGDHSAADILFPLSAYGSGLTLISNGAKFTINSTGTAQPIIFKAAEQSVLRFVGDWAAEDLGGKFYPTASSDKGARLFVVGKNCQGIGVDSITARNMLTAFGSVTDNAPGTSGGINIGMITIDGTLYGFNLQDQGDHARVGMIKATHSGRAFFVYGVDDVQATVDQADPQAGRTSMIKRYSRDTTNIKLNISDVRDWVAAGMVADLQMDNNSNPAARIANVEININAVIRNPPADILTKTGLAAVAMHNFAAGGSTLAITSSQHWDNIKVIGRRGISYPWLLWASFTSLSPKGTLTLPVGEPVHPALAGMFNITSK